MATGVPFFISENAMEELIDETHGNCQAIARKLKVDAATIYRWFQKHPKMDKLMAEARQSGYENDIDSSENVLRFCLSNCKDNSARALEAAKYILNAKGKRRGWTPESLDVAIEKRIREMQQREMDIERKKYNEEHGIVEEVGD